MNASSLFCFKNAAFGEVQSQRSKKYTRMFS